MGPLGYVFVSDVVQGKVLNVRINHNPANVTMEMDRLEQLLESLFSMRYCIVSYCIVFCRVQ